MGTAPVSARQRTEGRRPGLGTTHVRPGSLTSFLTWQPAAPRELGPRGRRTGHQGEVTMVKLTCLIRRKEGMSPEEFHAYWRDRHGPLVLSTRSGSHVVRYEQHHRSLGDYGPKDDGGYDGVTEQWFESMDEYNGHIAEQDL